MTAGALEGLRVLELSRLLPGALCTQMLGDLGADVIKVEQPGIGDYQRGFAPRGVEDGASFLMCNRNKRSITLDLKHPYGKAVLERLASTADVLVEGFRPGVMARLGLDHPALDRLNPRLVYVSLTGFGQDGPYARLPGHDLNYLGVAGALPFFARPGTGPQVPSMLVADIGGGTLPALYGVLAALIARSASGRGQHVDVSMTDGAANWLGMFAAERLFGGALPEGGRHRLLGGAPAYGLYRCGCGAWLTLGIVEPHFWERFCALIERPDLSDSLSPDDARRGPLAAELQAVFLTRSREDWLDALWQADIPAGPMHDLDAAFDDPQMRHRDMLQWIDHPVEGRIPQIGFPVKFGGTPAAMRRPPPRLGEHTDEILAELGHDAAAIRGLVEGGATG